MISRRWVLAALGAAVATPARAGAARRDLEGFWTGASYTNLERPKELKALVLTPAEAEAWEAPLRAQSGMPPSKPGEIGQSESEFNERGTGLARIRGEIRASLIVDPPDGRIPYTPAFAAEMGLAKPPVERMDGPEQRPASERCLTSTLSGAPMIPGPDTSVIQFVPAPGVLAIVCEKYHEVRVIPIGAAVGLPARLTPSWTGTSAGRWEGDALVVETAGFRPGVTNRGQRVFLSDAARVTERFTRTGTAEIAYAFEVTDPAILTRPWRAELRLVPSGPIYEYACHEGNYGLPDILSAARQAEGVVR